MNLRTKSKHEPQFSNKGRRIEAFGVCMCVSSVSVRVLHPLVFLLVKLELKRLHMFVWKVCGCVFFLSVSSSTSHSRSRTSKKEPEPPCWKGLEEEKDFDKPVAKRFREETDDDSA